MLRRVGKVLSKHRLLVVHVHVIDVRDIGHGSIPPVSRRRHVPMQQDVVGFDELVHAQVSEVGSKLELKWMMKPYEVDDIRHDVFPSVPVQSLFHRLCPRRQKLRFCPALYTDQIKEVLLSTTHQRLTFRVPLPETLADASVFVWLTLAGRFTSGAISKLSNFVGSSRAKRQISNFVGYTNTRRSVFPDITQTYPTDQRDQTHDRNDDKCPSVRHGVSTCVPSGQEKTSINMTPLVLIQSLSS